MNKVQEKLGDGNPGAESLLGTLRINPREIPLLQSKGMVGTFWWMLFSSIFNSDVKYFKACTYTIISGLMGDSSVDRAHIVNQIVIYCAQNGIPKPDPTTIEVLRNFMKGKDI